MFMSEGGVTPKPVFDTSVSVNSQLESSLLGRLVKLTFHLTIAQNMVRVYIYE